MSLALLVTGARGLLGSELLLAVREGRDCLARGLDRRGLDLTDPFAVRDVVGTWARVLRADGPHRLVVVNCAAWTDVDGAETAEPDAYAVNAAGAAVLAATCLQVGARLLHVSTDYVFPGNSTTPYDVDDATGPTTAYGRTKLAGELAVREVLPDASWVVRTSWLFGPQRGFVGTVAARAERGEPSEVVDDQRGSPTSSADLAPALLALAGSDTPPGTLHATGGGDTTWFGLARTVYEQLGADAGLVTPTSTGTAARPAARPSYSVLSDRSWSAAGLPPLPGWTDALARALAARGRAGDRAVR